MRCEKCNAYIPEGANICLECGNSAIKEIVCQKCGTSTSPNAKFCKKCGAKLTLPPDVTTVQSDNPPCEKCGSRIPVGVKYCPTCGTSREKKDHTAAGTQTPEEINETDSAFERHDENKKCISCGTILRSTGRFCHECGKFQGTDIEDVICPSCGLTNILRYARCQYCGKPLPSKEK